MSVTQSIEDLRASRDLCVALLRTVSDRDWSETVPDLDMDVAHLVAHISQTGYWYSIDLTAGGDDVTAVVPQVDAAASPDDLIMSIHVGGDLLAAAVAGAPEESRGFHPYGQADPSGFAAMACDEMLIHSHDIARAYDVDFEPPAELADRVVKRLFPWIAGDQDPWTLLQFANGRIALAGEPRREKWRWHCAPLSEWDGTIP